MSTDKPDLDTVTPEQKAMVEAAQERWLQAGLSTEQATDQQMRDAVDAVYRATNLEPPRHCFFFDSPRAGALAVAVLKRHYEQFPERERDNIPVPEGLLDVVQEYHDDIEKVPFDIKELTSEAYSEACYGQHDASTVVEYDIVRQLDGLPADPVVEARMEVILHCGWWWPMEKIAVVSRKNTELHLDDEGKPHNETGMAIKFADQYGIYSIHGVMVPEKVIMDPGSITEHDIEEAQAELNNVAVVTIMRERRAAATI